jgi:hypothetical protein
MNSRQDLIQIIYSRCFLVEVGEILIKAAILQVLDLLSDLVQIEFKNKGYSNFNNFFKKLFLLSFLFKTK